MRLMKDSGYPWIGDIPEGTPICRLKLLSYMKGRIGWQGLKSEDFIENGPYCVTGTDFINGKINWDTCYHVSEERYEMDASIHLRIGDLLVTKDGTIGKLAKVTELPGKACLNSHLLIIRPTNGQFTNEYLYYVMSSPVFTGYYRYSSTGSIMDSLSQKNTGEFAFPLYNLETQRIIVSFLDSRCAKIDEAIERHKKIIEKLEEYRKSVINHSVLHGLNDDVSERGSEVIGSYPAHWRISRLKYVANVVRGGSPRPIDDYITDSDGYNWIKIGDATGNGKYINSTKQKIKKEGLSKSRLVHPGTLLLTNSMSFGHPYILNIDGCIHDGWLAFSDYSDIEQDYLYYFLMSDSAMNQFVRSVEGSVVNNLNIEKVRNSLITIPPQKEQTEIVAFLDEHNLVIDNAISRQQTSVEKLEEYRKSLIYNAVTGKIDCR